MCRNTVQDASCEYQMRAKIGPYGENLRPRVTVNVTIAKHNEKRPDFRRNQWGNFWGQILVEVIHGEGGREQLGCGSLENVGKNG